MSKTNSHPKRVSNHSCKMQFCCSTTVARTSSLRSPAMRRQPPVGLAIALFPVSDAHSSHRRSAAIVGASAFTETIADGQKHPIPNPSNGQESLLAHKPRATIRLPKRNQLRAFWENPF
jgi:hypothetical protein